MKKIYLIATIVAIITGFATYFFAAQIKENSTIQDVRKETVVVALVDIPVDTVITAEMVTTVELPYMSVTNGAAINVADLVGRMTVFPIVMGEQILANKVAAVGVDGSSGKLSYELKEGEYPYMINVDTLSSLGSYIRANDIVDIYSTFTVKQKDAGRYRDSSGRVVSVGETAVEPILQKIRILKLDGYPEALSAQANGVENTTYASVILILTRQQIKQITEAELNGTLRLQLIPYVEAVDIEDQVSAHTAEIQTVFGGGSLITTAPETTVVE